MLLSCYWLGLLFYSIIHFQVHTWKSCSSRERWHTALFSTCGAVKTSFVFLLSVITCQKGHACTPWAQRWHDIHFCWLQRSYRQLAETVSWHCCKKWRFQNIKNRFVAILWGRKSSHHVFKPSRYRLCIFKALKTPVLVITV